MMFTNKLRLLSTFALISSKNNMTHNYWASVPATNNPSMMSFRPVDDNKESTTKSLRAVTSPTCTMEIEMFSKEGTHVAKQIPVTIKCTESISESVLSSAPSLGTISSSLSEDEDEIPVPSEIKFLTISRSASIDSDLSGLENIESRKGDSDLLGLRFLVEEIVVSDDLLSVASLNSITL